MATTTSIHTRGPLTLADLQYSTSVLGARRRRFCESHGGTSAMVGYVDTSSTSGWTLTGCTASAPTSDTVNYSLWRGQTAAAKIIQNPSSGLTYLFARHATNATLDCSNAWLHMAHYFWNPDQAVRTASHYTCKSMVRFNMSNPYYDPWNGIAGRVTAPPASAPIWSECWIPVMQSGITSIDLQFPTTAGFSAAVSMADISFWPKPTKPTILLCIDDLVRSLAKPNVWDVLAYAAGAGVPVTGVLVHTLRDLGGSTYSATDLANLRTYQAAGHRFINGSWNHHTEDDGLNYAQRRADFVQMAEWMAANGLVEGSRIICAPGNSSQQPWSFTQGDMDDLFDGVALDTVCNYASTTTPDSSGQYCFNHWGQPSLGGNYFDFASGQAGSGNILRDMIAKAIANNACIVATTDASNAAMKTEFEALIDYVASMSASITAKTVPDYFYGRMS
jgi:hypothetical protein